MDSSTVVQNILNSKALETWSTTISILGFLLGFFFIVAGCIMWVQETTQSQGRQQGKISAPILSIVAGLLLLSLQAFITAGTVTLFADPNTGDFAYENGMVNIAGSYSAGSAITAETKPYIQLALMMLQLLGLISVIRSASLLRKANESSQNAPGAAWHFIGGIIALNFPTFMGVLGNTAGSDVSTVIGKIFG